MPTTASDRVFRVFLSSSFRDMHDERDYLQKHAFAYIETELRDMGYHLQVFDLRGSASNPDLLEEEAVFRLCLEALDEARPRMIALLGDRYGWIPYGPSAVYPDDGARARAEMSVARISDAPDIDITADEFRDISVTHLEIVYALKKSDPAHLFFYERTGLPYGEMDAKTARLYTDGQMRQEAMRQEIRTHSGGQNYWRYTAGWDAGQARVTHLEELDQMVYRHLHDSIFQELAQLGEKTEVGEQYDSKDVDQNVIDFIDQELSHYTPLHSYYERMEGNRDPLVEDVLAAVTGGISGRLYVLAGPDGVGKTMAMLAMLCALRQEEGLLVVPYLAGRGRNNDESITMLLHLLNELLPATQQEDGEALARETIAYLKTHPPVENTRAQRTFVEGLAGYARAAMLLAAKRQPVILLLADLENVSDLDRRLRFLPNMHKNIHVVASAPEGYLKPAVSYSTVRLPRLWCAEDAKLLLQTFAGLHGKRLSEEILARAAEKVLGGDATPLYAKVLADTLMTMTAADYNRYASPDGHLHYMRHMLDTLPDSTEGAYGVILGRLVDEFGEVAKGLLGLLAITRVELNTRDTQQALGYLVGQGIPSGVTLLQIRGQLKGNLKSLRRRFTWQASHSAFQRGILRFLADTPGYTRRCAHAMATAILAEDYPSHMNDSDLLWFALESFDTKFLAEYLRRYVPEIHGDYLRDFLRDTLPDDDLWIRDYLEKAFPTLAPAAQDIVAHVLMDVVPTLAPRVEAWTDFESLVSFVKGLLAGWPGRGEEPYGIFGVECANALLTMLDMLHDTALMYEVAEEMGEAVDQLFTLKDAGGLEALDMLQVYSRHLYAHMVQAQCQMTWNNQSETADILENTGRLVAQLDEFSHRLAELGDEYWFDAARIYCNTKQVLDGEYADSLTMALRHSNQLRACAPLTPHQKKSLFHALWSVQNIIQALDIEEEIRENGVDNRAVMAQALELGEEVGGLFPDDTEFYKHYSTLLLQAIQAQDDPGERFDLRLRMITYLLMHYENGAIDETELIRCRFFETYFAIMQAMYHAGQYSKYAQHIVPLEDLLERLRAGESERHYARQLEGTIAFHHLRVAYAENAPDKAVRLQAADGLLADYFSHYAGLERYSLEMSDAIVDADADLLANLCQVESCGMLLQTGQAKAAAGIALRAIHALSQVFRLCHSMYSLILQQPISRDLIISYCNIWEMRMRDCRERLGWLAAADFGESTAAVAGAAQAAEAEMRERMPGFFEKDR